MRQTPKVFHFEDEPLLAKYIGDTLSGWKKVNYLGFSMSIRLGMEICRNAAPDIVIVDLGLADGDGFDLIGQLSRLTRPPRVLVLTGRSDDVTLFRLSTAEVFGLVWKTELGQSHLKSAILALMSGNTFFAGELSSSLRRLRNSPSAFFKVLSTTESTLLPYFGYGYSDERIAAAVGRRAATVKWHRRRILARLGLHHTVELMAWAREKGFVRDFTPAPPCAIPR